jgi:osmotically-inducible protein OsmY
MPHIGIMQKSMLICGFALSLSSCAMFEGRETGGQYVDDATITAKVKEAFIADPQVQAAQIHVETMQGAVQLSGFVDSPKSEAKAVELARKVNGVQSVADNIIVRGSSSHNN